LVMYPLLHSSQWTPNGPNRALYKNEKYDELLHQARLTTDQAKRAELYRQAQRLLIEDAPWIFVDHEIQTAAHSKRVQGFKLHPSFDLRVETISLKCPGSREALPRPPAPATGAGPGGGVDRHLRGPAPLAGGSGRDHARLATPEGRSCPAA